MPQSLESPGEGLQAPALSCSKPGLLRPHFPSSPRLGIWHHLQALPHSSFPTLGVLTSPWPHPRPRPRYSLNACVARCAEALASTRVAAGAVVALTEQLAALAMSTGRAEFLTAPASEAGGAHAGAGDRVAQGAVLTLTPVAAVGTPVLAVAACKKGYAGSELSLERGSTWPYHLLGPWRPSCWGYLDGIFGIWRPLSDSTKPPSVHRS